MEPLQNALFGRVILRRRNDPPARLRYRAGGIMLTDPPASGLPRLRKRELEVKGGAAMSVSSYGLLAATSIGKRFGASSAPDVSFSIERGEIYGLIGPNGAARLRCSMAHRLYMPDSGNFTFDGAPLDRLNRTKSRSAASRARFRTSACSRTSALENVMIGRHIRTRARRFRAAVFRDRRRSRKSRALSRGL